MERCYDEICVNCNKRYGEHYGVFCSTDYSEKFKPKEDKPMTEQEFMKTLPKVEKIQMTVGEASDMLVNVFNNDESSLKINLLKLSEKGYIRKSELQTLVDEAEEKFALWNSKKCMNEFSLIIKQEETIQALKKDHPEFKK